METQWVVHACVITDDINVRGSLWGCPPIRAHFQPVNPNAPFVHRLRGGRPAVVRDQVAGGRAHDDALENEGIPCGLP